MPTFYEFFAGGGMARAGFGSGWQCLFANDIDQKKAASYRENYGGGHELILKDVGEVSTSEVPGSADLIWASFPCQDLSLAGMGAGLKGSRSGTFWPFWKLAASLKSEDRSPSMIVLENVCGALTSHNGQDFASLIEALRIIGYRSGALVIDAALFLPQSRPRLFIVGVREDISVDPQFYCALPQAPFHTTAVVASYNRLPPANKDAWLWWHIPTPQRRQSNLIALLEESAPWHPRVRTKQLLDLMSPLNRAKVEAAQKLGLPILGTIYRRTRVLPGGEKVQRAEVRFDNIAGCLRTPGGGSSRQTILYVKGEDVRSRLLSPREAARLMGLPDTYILPTNYNDAYHLMGDGVAVSVVRHLAEFLLEPILKYGNKSATAAA